MKLKYKKLYSSILAEYESLSTCDRLHVAALLVKDGRILSVGYNGTPSEFLHCNRLFSHADGKYRVHQLAHTTCIPNAKYDESGWMEIDESAYRQAHHAFAENYEIHAEMNCLAFALRSGIDVKDCELVLSVAPCMNCAKLIASSGIRKVSYVNKYDRSMDGENFLQKCGVFIAKLDTAKENQNE